MTFVVVDRSLDAEKLHVVQLRLRTHVLPRELQFEYLLSPALRQFINKTS